MSQYILDYTNKYNFKLVAKLYGIKIPEGKGIRFVKNELKSYDEILNRGRIHPPTNKNLNLYTSRELVRYYPFLMIDSRYEMVKNLKIYLKSDIKLLPRQVEPYNKMMDRFDEDFFYISTAKPGTGKTIISLLAAKEFGFPVILICPKRLKFGWLEDANRCGVKILKIISYGGISSKTGYQPTHGLLTKEENDGKIKFKPTEKLINYIEEGVLIVYDEFSKIKNKAPSSTKAARALNKTLMSMNTKSRILFLSGTPITEAGQIVNLLRLTGIIRNEKNKTKNDKLLQIYDVIEECKKINLKGTNYIINKVGNYKNKNSMIKLLLSLYSEILKDKISGGIPSPELKGIHLQIRNVYFNLEDNYLEKLNNAIIEMGVASLKFLKSKKLSDNETQTQKEERLMKLEDAKKKFLYGRLECEKIKTEIMRRVTKEKLENEPNCKVILCCNFYKGVITKLIKDLEKYKPLQFHGKLSEKAAEENLRKFKEPTGDYRLLICTTKSGSLGLNLQDKTSKWKRYMFIMPDNSMETIYQALLRIWREGTKSDCVISIVYAKGAYKEESVLRSMRKQSAVTKLTLDNLTLDESIFPDDYPNYFEDGTKVPESMFTENKEDIIVKIPDELK